MKLYTIGLALLILCVIHVTGRGEKEDSQNHADHGHDGTNQEVNEDDYEEDSQDDQQEGQTDRRQWEGDYDEGEGYQEEQNYQEDGQTSHREKRQAKNRQRKRTTCNVQTDCASGECCVQRRHNRGKVCVASGSVAKGKGCRANCMCSTGTQCFQRTKPRAGRATCIEASAVDLQKGRLLADIS